MDDVNDWDVWDTVIYQDPSAGPDLELDASTWHENISDIVIGASATSDAQANFNEYGDSVVLRGSTQHGPYAY